MQSLKRIFGTDSIPPGVRLLTIMTSIRWMGWGLAENLIPVFLFSFAGGYASAGLLRSILQFTAVLVLPIIGLASDRFRPSTLLTISLTIYLSIGTSYFLAGTTGMIVFIVIARILNGVSSPIDEISRETYTKRSTDKEKIATVFGYVDTVTNFWWIVASLIGIILIKFLSLHALLFFITPTSLICLVIVWRFRRQGYDNKVEAHTDKMMAYRKSFKEVISWDWRLRFLAVIDFFLAFTTSVIAFFLPIDAYNQGAGFGKIVLIGVFLAIPSLFGWLLGKWFDRAGVSLFRFGLIVLGLLIGLLAFYDSYFLKLFIAFAVGVIMELLAVGKSSLITQYSKPECFGLIGSIMKTMGNTGSIVGPILVGVLIDWQGLHISFLYLAVLTLAFAGTFYGMQKSGYIGSVSDRYHAKVHGRHNPAAL